MGSEQLLIGNLAISAVVIKTIISAFKQMFPMKPLYTQIATMLLGIGAAFVLDANLITMTDPSAVLVILQKGLAGLFIGATSMGVHETTKAITNHA